MRRKAALAHWHVRKDFTCPGRMEAMLLATILLLAFAAPAGSDIAQRLARWKQVEMPYDPSELDARQRQVVAKLAEASRSIESIYWQQSDPEGLALYGSTKDPQLKRLLAINGGRFDLIDENKPFVGTKPIPPGRNIYPPRAHPLADRGLRQGASSREGCHLQSLHGAALERQEAGCDSLSRRVQEGPGTGRASAARGGRTRARTRRSQNFCGCAPMRC